MSSASLVLAAEVAIAIPIDIAQGDIAGALKKARQLVDMLVLMVPVGGMRDELTDEDRKLADLAADVAEEEKLGTP